MRMLGDNKTSLTLTKNSKSQNQTKHINVMQYHIRALGEDRELAINLIASFVMIADSFTKILPVALFTKHCGEWGFIK